LGGGLRLGSPIIANSQINAVFGFGVNITSTGGEVDHTKHRFETHRWASKSDQLQSYTLTFSYSASKHFGSGAPSHLIWRSVGLQHRRVASTLALTISLAINP